MKKLLLITIILVSTIAGVAYAYSPQYGINNGLLAYFSLDTRNSNWTSDTVGKTSDISGNGVIATFTNMSLAASKSNGKIGQGYTLDATNDYIDLGSAVTLTAGSPFSISWWEKVTADTVTYPSRFNLDIAGTTNYFLVIRGGTAGGTYGPISFGISPNTNLSVRTTTGPSVLTSIGLWKHWVITGIDPNSTTASDYNLYVNGVAQNTLSGPTFGGITNNRIGYDGTDGASDVTMDEVRIYNRALSSNEVTQLYRQGFNN